MIRNYIQNPPQFNLRGKEPMRLENLSDAVFAFSITLLVMTSEAPKNFEDLLTFSKSILSFAFSITIIMLIWHEHNTFFLRYGLRNNKIVFLNSILLLLIVFFIYPLKWLTAYIAGLITNGFLVSQNHEFIKSNQMPDLMIFYALGIISIYFTLYLMYKQAFSQKFKLKLNLFEIFETKARMNSNLLMIGLPILSIFIVKILENYSVGLASALSGMIYTFYFPMFWIFRKKYDKQLIKVLKNENILKEIEFTKV